MKIRSLSYSAALVLGFSAVGVSFADDAAVGPARMIQTTDEAAGKPVRETKAGGVCGEDVPCGAGRLGGPDLQAYIEAHREILARSGPLPGSRVRHYVAIGAGGVNLSAF